MHPPPESSEVNLFITLRIMYPSSCSTLYIAAGCFHELRTVCIIIIFADLNPFKCRIIYNNSSFE